MNSARLLQALVMPWSLLARRAVRGFLLAAGALVTSGPLLTAEPPKDFRSLGDSAVVLYDGPSFKANKVFVASRNYPVEVLVKLGNWVKVRDSAGDLAWIESKSLSARRTVMVTAALADVRQGPDDKAELLFQAEKSVVLELDDATSGVWAKVRHRDGQAGYVRVDQIWGI
jgi:SH3-like domain-containing protein